MSTSLFFVQNPDFLGVPCKPFPSTWFRQDLLVVLFIWLSFAHYAVHSVLQATLAQLEYNSSRTRKSVQYSETRPSFGDLLSFRSQRNRQRGREKGRGKGKRNGREGGKNSELKGVRERCLTVVHPVTYASTGKTKAPQNAPVLIVTLYTTRHKPRMKYALVLGAICSACYKISYIDISPISLSSYRPWKITEISRYITYHSLEENKIALCWSLERRKQQY